MKVRPSPKHLVVFLAFLGILATASVRAETGLPVGADQQASPQTAPSVVTPRVDNAAPKHAKTTSALSFTPVPVPANYQLMIKDRLRFSVDEDPVKHNDAIEVMVTDMGEADFPVSRGFDTYVTMKVQGKTLAEVRKELKVRLDAQYYQDAHVDVQVLSRNLKIGTVQLFGAIRGLVRLLPNEPKTLTDSILELGYGDFANLKKVTLTRVNPDTKKTTSIVVNVQKILEGDRHNDVLLEDGDRIEVAEKSFYIK